MPSIAAQRQLLAAAFVAGLITLAGAGRALGATRVQTQSGTAQGTVTVSWSPATTNGNMLIATIACRGGTGIGITAPSGWIQAARANSGTTVATAIYYNASASSRSSESFTCSGSNWGILTLIEYSGLTTLDKTQTNTGINTTAQNTGTTATTTASNAIAIAAFGASNTPNYSGYSSGYSELADVIQYSGPINLATAEKVLSSTGTESCSANAGYQVDWAAAIATFAATGGSGSGPGTTSGVQAVSAYAQGAISATWPSTTTSGNMLVATVACRGGTGTSITPPAGWTLAIRSDNGTDVASAIYYYAGAPARTSETFTCSGSNWGTLTLIEYSSSYTTLDKTASATANSSTSCSSGTTAATSASNEVAVAIFGTSGTPSFSGYTNSFSEVADVRHTSGPVSGATAERILSSTGAQSVTGTASSSVNCAAAIAVFGPSNRRYWIGSSAGSFDDATRWSMTSGGANNAGVPTSSNVAVFNSGGTGECRIHSRMDVLGLLMDTGAGTVRVLSDTGQGLYGAYYSGTSFNTYVGGALDSTINYASFESTLSSRAGSSTNVSVRWVGQFFANYSETYTFYGYSDDGIRITVNGSQIVNDWNDHAAREASGSIYLNGGTWYDIRVEYYQSTGPATLQLSFASPSESKKIIPAWSLRPPRQTIGSSDLTIKAGSFIGGGPIDIAGGLSLPSGSTGTFTSTSGVLTIGTTFSRVGGTFNANGGTVLLKSPSAQSHTSGGVTFYNLAVNQGLVGYWKLDETSGTSAADSSGYGVTGTWGNSPTASTDVPSALRFTDGRSLSFGGAQYVDLGNPDHLNFSGQITIAAWIKTSTTDGWRYIVSHGVRQNPWGEVYFRVSSGAYEIGVYNGSDHRAAYSIPGGDSGQWVHLAGVYDGTTWRLYRNGVQVATSTDGQGAMTVGASWAIGARAPNCAYNALGNPPDRFFNGLIDDVRIYNRGLTAAEVSALASGGQAGLTLATQSFGAAFTASNDVIIAGGTLDVGAGGISVGGNLLTAEGLFAGALTLSGSSAGKMLRTSASRLSGLTVSGAGSWTLEDPLDVTDGTLAVNAGTLAAGAYTVRAGSMSGAGTFTSAGTTVLTASSGGPTLAKTGTFTTLRVEDPAEADLVGYWKMDEAGGTTLRDWSGTGNTGTLVNGASWVSGASSLPSTLVLDNQSAIALDGSNDHVTLGTTSLPAANANQTISLWVYYASVPASVQDFISLMGSSSQVTLGFRSNAITAWKTSGTTLVTASSTPASGWHHVAYSFDGTTHRLYVDGGTPATSTVAPTSGAVTSAWLGTYNGSAELFAGRLDDVRVYATTLSAKQIASLAAGRHAGTGGTVTFTLGANVTVAGELAIDSGTLATSSYTLNAAASDSSKVATVHTGGLTVGSSTVTFNGGLTVQPFGTLAVSTPNGVLRVGSGKVLGIDGALVASNAGTPATIRSVSGSYSFRVGTVSGATPTVNIDGLAVQNTDTNGLFINANTGATTTITRLDNVAFSSGTGSYALQIYANTLQLASRGLSFGAGPTYNVKLQGNGTADGETRAMFGSATCASPPCETYDADDDANDDGTGDNAGDSAVAQWLHRSQTDTAGVVEGFPVPAFNWNTFAYWNTYVVFRDVDGTTDRLYARDVNGDYKNTSGGAGYSWDLPAGVGDIVGSPRWQYEGSTYYVYLVTSNGSVYKIADSGSAFTTVAGWPYRNTTGGSAATATSPLALDATNVYWCGNDGAGARKMFSLSVGKTLNTPRTVVADVIAAPASATVSGTRYLFTATNGRVYRTPIDLSSEITATQPTSTVNGRLTIMGGLVYFVEDIGKLWAVSASTLATSWSYQDTNVSRHAGGCSANSACTIESFYFDPLESYAYFGDRDGHIYVVYNNSGTGTALANYPFRPGTSADVFEVAPLYRAGVIVAGTTGGKVYVIDRRNASSAPALIKAYGFGAAVSSISFNSSTSSAGAYVIATQDGHLYYIDSIGDPTGSRT